MKRFALVFTLLLAMAPAVFAVPAEAGRLGLFFSGGLNLPQGDLSDGTKNGAVLGAGLTYSLNHRLSIGGEVATNSIGVDDDVLSLYGDGASMDLSIVQYTGFLKMSVTPPANHQVYLKGGLGSYEGKVSLRVHGQEAESSASEFGFGLGGGFQINGKSGTALTVESMFHHVAADGGGADFVTTTVGIHFTIK